MSQLEDLTRDYRIAFLRYLPRREEAPLASGYELGRAAVVEGVSILELARVHHEVLLEALRETPHEELAALATAASEFFLEVLATFDMTQRAFFEDTLSPGTGASGTADSPGRESGPGEPGTGG
jgi:Phosphoserine phosphatase RsbU, N-terminal domain